MSIDLTQFFAVFFEESLEGLDVMEAELLNLQPGNADSETINTIFRAAHSIKGGSGTFGFVSVSDFTHVLETLLDQIRDGQRQLTQQHVDLLLQSVDCVRAMIASLQSEQEPDLSIANALKQQFEAILASSESAAASAPVVETVAAQEDQCRFWQITFKPQVHLFRTGNEPLFMFRELADLGTVSVRADVSSVPAFSELFVEDCHLSWIIQLQGNVSEQQIKTVFEWVEDDADIQIEEIGGLFADDPAPAPAVNSAPVVEVTAPVVVEKASAEKAPAKVEPEAKSKANAENTSIRVGIDKVDSLINMVGELVITQAMLSQLGEGELTESKLASLREGLAQLAHNTRDLQESVMRIRMLPISFVFSRFPRLVRDISQKLGKKVELKLIGENTELDKTVMEKISDPMVHLIRNSLDHGLETPEERVTWGKDETGTVTLNAFHQGGNIIIEIIDDGRGLNTEKIRSKAIANGLIKETDDLSDAEINDLIFKPGFSTADQISDISGRGVGMDVVKRNIHALNGSIEVESEPHVGTTFTIRLPLTLAILDGQLVTVGGHIYIIPLINIIESLQVDLSKVNCVGGGIEVLRLRDEYVPIIRLYQVFSHQNAVEELDKGLLVIVEADNEKVGVLVDDLLAQQQVVIKSLEQNYQRVEGISGATILGDGRVSLIIDISGIVKQAGLRRAGRKGLTLDLSALAAGEAS